MPTSRHRPSSSPTDRRRADLRRRRELERAQEAAARREAHRRLRMRLAAGSGIVVAAAGAIFGLYLLFKPGPKKPVPPSLRSELVRGAAGTLALSSPPLPSYRVVYKVETFPAGEKKGVTPAVTTEEVSVRRPLQGRVFEKQGDPPGGNVQLDIRTDLGLQGDYTDPASPKLRRQEPVLALSDIRLDASRDALIDGKLFVPKERRKVLGRECQVYRTGSPLESLSVTAPSDQIYVDACVDAEGLLLEELTVNGGTLTNRRTATEVDDRAELAPDVFKIDMPPAGGDGGVGLVPLDLSTTPAPGIWVFKTAPAGYSHVARYAFTQVAGDTTTPPGYYDVYTSGSDAVIVQQGPKDSEPEEGILPGTDVDAGGLGAAKVVPGLAGNVLTANPNPSWFVRVTATMKADALTAIAKGLSV